MKHIIGVGEMCVSDVTGDVVVTHALGSCLGITMYDPLARVGGMLHAMLPTRLINPEKAEINPFMFVDSGVAVLLRQLLEAGADKRRLVIKVAGGSVHQGDGIDRFAIGKRNYITLRKLLWRNELLIESEDIGGVSPRTMFLEIGTGRVWLNSLGREKTL